MKFNYITDEGGANSSNFLKIADGESVTGVFMGDEYCFYIKWVGGKSVLTEKNDPEGKQRLRNNFITTEKNSNEPVVKIWEFSPTVYKKLEEISKEYPLDETKIKITRRGTGTNTEYELTALAGRHHDLKPEQIKVLKQIPLLKLEKKASAPTNGAYAPSPTEDDMPNFT